MKTLLTLLTVALILHLSSCYNDETKIKDLELKLEQKENQINQEKEERLLNEIDQKEREIEELKNKNLKQKETNLPNYFARGKGFFPEGSERLLVEEDLIYLSPRELKIMRNEIFARHGYIFKTSDMINHFRGESWYRPMYNDVSSMLSSYEKANIKLIKLYE